ncbi:MAG: hypothetical protein CVU71_03620 [Deltaproteobacteria bacterium HGW-Deltaproteobacteria-6]|jgi:hypothetical protein|nr:MAG: hypothetical protein CVU71_03620 [Deltaproteobacteria bacterium HGW-Deltaproteobacteria-6]
MSLLFLYNNLLDSATLTASSAATGFPANNLKNPHRTKTWKTAGATAGTAQLVIDHGTAKAVNAIALTGYDWAAAPGTLQVEFNATDSWGSPSVTETLTWVSGTTPGGNKGTIIKKLAADRTYRYNRLSVVNAPGDWNLGRLFVGQYFEPARTYGWGYQESVIDPSLIAQTIGGQDHADEIEKYRIFSCSGVIATQAQWVLYQAMLNSVGLHKEIFAALDYTNDPIERTIYGKFSKLPAVTRPFNFNYDFEFTEAR